MRPEDRTTDRVVAVSGELVPEVPWQRLDPRMLLVHPVRELVRFIPVLLGIFLAGSGNGGGWWQVAGVGIPIGLGLLRYLTTTFRIHDGRVQLQHGLLNKHVVSTALDRVRTVDLTASPIHRLLGLTQLRIGTGSGVGKGDEQPLTLDGLPRTRAQQLRAELLHSIATPTPERAQIHGVRVVTRFAPEWLRFAPFTTSGLVIAGGVVGLGSQLAGELGLWDRIDPDSLATTSLAALLGAAVGVLVLVVGLSVLGYLVTNYGFTLSHTLPDGSWHVRRGLLTVRETSLDDDRVTGVVLGEPIGLRLAGGRRVSAVVTGLGHEHGGRSSLVPPAPREVAEEVAAELVGTRAPIDVALTPHGPRATRRRYTRALVPALVVASALGFGPWWAITLGVLLVVAAAALAFDRARSLGHALSAGRYVARHGSLTRSRTVVSTGSIIGWNLRSTWFQRRAGLVTLTATMAGGSQSIRLPDIPRAQAVDVAEAATPGLLTAFTGAVRSEG
jgi:putative membrane protein